LSEDENPDCPSTSKQKEQLIPKPNAYSQEKRRTKTLLHLNGRIRKQRGKKPTHEVEKKMNENKIRRTVKSVSLISVLIFALIRVMVIQCTYKNTKTKNKMDLANATQLVDRYICIRFPFPIVS